MDEVALLLVSTFSVFTLVLLVISCACCKGGKNENAKDAEKDAEKPVVEQHKDKVADELAAAEAAKHKKAAEHKKAKEKEGGKSEEHGAEGTAPAAEPKEAVKDEKAPKETGVAVVKESLDPPPVMDIPAFTIMTEKEASTADTVVEMRARQEFKPTLYLPTEAEKNAMKMPSVKKDMITAKSMFGAAITARDFSMVHAAKKEAPKTQRAAEQTMPPKSIVASPATKKESSRPEKSHLARQPTGGEKTPKNGVRPSKATMTDTRRAHPEKTPPRDTKSVRPEKAPTTSAKSVRPEKVPVTHGVKVKSSAADVKHAPPSAPAGPPQAKRSLASVLV